MPEFFKKLGYYTAHLGKFHHSPRKRFPYDFVHRDENTASKFIAGYREEKPLLLVVCTHPPHTPWVKNTTYDCSEIDLPPNFVDTRETRLDRANYYSDVTLMDSILGNVLRSLEKHGRKSCFDPILFAGRSLYLAAANPAARRPFIMVQRALERRDKVG
ncbi:MAG: sulfatase-like hydrolase/transferase [Planctomycetes bacterium]|nr:sulfatase-like hydrolase/transferase [Planctomycetota bacterium]MBL7039632.1 sulfatase-like hydrolase/transferase [Pirellulaceae bacterium]